MQGIIYWIHDPKIPKTGKKLAGSYFLPPIHEQTIEFPVSDDSEDFGLIFFNNNGGETQKTICLIFIKVENLPLNENEKKNYYKKAQDFIKDHQGDSNKKPEMIGKFIWQVSDSPNYTEISKFIRESDTLTEEQYGVVSSIKVAADPKGLAIIGKGQCNLGDREVKVLKAQLLALAYIKRFERIINELSKVIASDNEMEVEKMHRDLSKFMAMSYLSNPVSYNSTEISPVYVKVCEALRVKETVADLTSQLERVYQYTNACRNEREASLEKKIQKKISQYGLIIAIIGVVLGLAQIIQTSPAQLFKSLHDWREYITGHNSLGTVDPTAIHGQLNGNKNHPAGRHGNHGVP